VLETMAQAHLSQKFFEVLRGKSEQFSFERHQGPSHAYWHMRFRLWIVPLLAVPYPVFAFIRGPVRRWRRQRKGLCRKCGYDLTGNVSGVCPECGTPT